MTWPERILSYVTLAVLVVAVLVIAFCLDTAPSVRARLWSVGARWESAADDAATTLTAHGRTVTATSTRDTALRLLLDTIGDL